MMDTETVYSEEAFRAAFSEGADAAFQFLQLDATLKLVSWSFELANLKPPHLAMARFFGFEAGTRKDVWLCVRSDVTGNWTIERVVADT